MDGFLAVVTPWSGAGICLDSSYDEEETKRVLRVANLELPSSRVLMVS